MFILPGLWHDPVFGTGGLVRGVLFARNYNNTILCHSLRQSLTVNEKKMSEKGQFVSRPF